MHVVDTVDLQYPTLIQFRLTVFYYSHNRSTENFFVNKTQYINVHVQSYILVLVCIVVTRLFIVPFNDTCQSIRSGRVMKKSIVQYTGRTVSWTSHDYTVYCILTVTPQYSCLLVYTVQYSRYTYSTVPYCCTQQKAQVHERRHQLK